jgi:hypothetical protein
MRVAVKVMKVERYFREVTKEEDIQTQGYLGWQGGNRNSKLPTLENEKRMRMGRRRKTDKIKMNKRKKKNQGEGEICSRTFTQEMISLREMKSNVHDK